MVSRPRLIRSHEKVHAAAGSMMWNSRPAVSPTSAASLRYACTLTMSSRSCGRFASSQKHAGVFERRARVTASLTQSLIAGSLVWQARQMSPASTACCMSTVPAASTTRTVPAAFISNVLSCEPYSSAFCAMSPTFGTEPIVFGSNAPFFRQKSTTAW